MISRDYQLYKNLQNARSHNLDGILKFTPQDFKDYTQGQSSGSTDVKGSQEQHGFKGFAGNNFERPNQPTAGQPLEVDLWKSPRGESYGVPHYLGNARHAGDGKEFRYGSDGINNAAKPGPLKGTLLNPKTRTPEVSAELRKFHHQQDQAESDIQKFKAEKIQKQHSREEEKKTDLHMLKNYHPWGKPGGGAPRKAGEEVEHKMTKIDTKQLFSVEADSPRKAELKREYGDFNSYFNKPGHGAPLRTESGSLKTQLKGDANLRFQDSEKGRVVNATEVRYQAPPGKKQEYYSALEEQVSQSKEKSQEQRLKELKQDMEMLQRYDPYGRPGAGAPNKTQSEETRAANRPNSDVFDPWGKGAGRPIRNHHGDVQRYKYANSGTKEPYTLDSLKKPVMEEGTMLEVDSGRGGGGAPVKTESGNVKVRHPITMRRNEMGDVPVHLPTWMEIPIYHSSVRDKQPGRTHKHEDPEHAVYDPWGRSGNGAPLRDERGQTKANVYGRLNDNQGSMSGDPRERQKAKQQILDDLQRDMEQHKINKDNRDKSGGADLAALMKRGQVGRPKRDPATGMLTNQHLGASDVTKLQTQERAWKTEESPVYHTELEKAATDRRNIQKLDRLKDKHDSSQHQSTMNDFWGRPGAGAPNQTRKKANLDNILYSPRKEKNYDLLTPYATNPEPTY